MEKANATKKYNWDIAISLCKQDIDFARKLVKALNPSLKVFFYENKQEELINKSGPEVFAKTFKEQSRVVVILSRKEWSKTYYTDIERNAIIDRTAVKNEGYEFLLIIPMVHGEIPSWYPSTRIYANPHRFTIEELAQFIEFKITEEGGYIKTLTVEDRYRNLLDRIEEKKKIIQLQHSKDAVEYAQKEVDLLKECFNDKIKFLQKSIFDRISTSFFSPHVNAAHFGMSEYLLECKILLPDEMYHRIVTTQDFCLQFELYKIFGQNNESTKLIEQEQRLFYYNPPLNGWALSHLYEQASEKELLVLFRNRDNSQFYDLTSSLTTPVIVDDWFQRLLSKSTQAIERYI